MVLFFLNFSDMRVPLPRVLSSHSFCVSESLLFCFSDPPPPSKPPAVEVTSHDSFKVKFSRFDPVNGPLTAYAVIITNSKGKDIAFKN